MSDDGTDWTAYYERIAGRPPRRTLLRALERFGDATGRLAVDLGCGDGRDTIELLRRGWRVVAIDAEPEAIRRLNDRPDLPKGTMLEARCARFEDAAWPAADLVNASFALPLVAPEHFAPLWAKIARSLKPGGRFAGQLFGPRDGWHGRDAITFLTRDEILRLLAGFSVEHFEEEETDATTPCGEAKHWHLFHIVARRES
ncbi:MAG TPA: class I SAM-dependent methyltransferase [Stellaceae bacterium]|nr:class I SAM-dependent methyltransferase [Stellaceae bacterium]